MSNLEQKLKTFSYYYWEDSTGKHFFILGSFLPNERAWVFCWVLQNIMSTLFNNNVLHRIKLIISDGDSSEFSQIDDEISRFFPNAYRCRCGYHIVDRGWSNYISNRKENNEDSSFMNIKKNSANGFILS